MYVRTEIQQLPNNRMILDGSTWKQLLTWTIEAKGAALLLRDIKREHNKKVQEL